MHTASVPPHDDTPGDREAASVANCGFLLDRLKAVIEDESAALSRRDVSYHGQFAERKNQLLRDILVAQRTCYSPRIGQALAPRAQELQKLLKRNQRLLKAHMDAVKEISSIIVDSIRQADSDGTYSRQFRA
jgi:flagellar biosynthesis/type III secretory pathway chaperone